METHLAPQGDDLFAEILHHLQQHIRAHMGFGIIEDILPGPKSHKLLQNPVNSGIADAGVQLAIRKGPRTPLAELDVAFGVQGSVLPEGRHLFMAGNCVLPPLQDDGPLACLS